jgi:drug/metabolite transporter (DMT)-like permease
MNKTSSAWLNGFIGVLIFSGSLPATRVAVQDFDPLFLTVARASIAGLLGLTLLLLLAQPRPTAAQWRSLLVVAFGVVLGFPLLTALALREMSSAHSIVFLGLLPLSTAAFGVWRGGERPRPVFWLFSLLGSLLVVGFALAQGLSLAPRGDALMLLAILVCGLGYAEGTRLSRSLGGWQVICWALVLTLPLMLGLSWWRLPASWGGIGLPA